MHSVSFYMIREVIEKNKVTELTDIQAIHQNMEKLVDWLPGLEGVEEEAIEWAGMPALRLRPPSSEEERTLLYLHGGAYCTGNAKIYKDLASRLGRAAHAQVLLPEYRLAPQAPFPAAIDDAKAAYQVLLEEGQSPEKLVVAGDSAGGGLTLALLMRLRDESIPLPAAAACMSPWTDLSCSGDSLKSRASFDPMLHPPVVQAFAETYLGEEDPRNPWASPLWGDVHDLPPIMIQVGTAEVLYDDAKRWVDKAKEAGNKIVFDPWDDMFHVWQICAGLMSEAHEALKELGHFLRAHSA